MCGNSHETGLLKVVQDNFTTPCCVASPSRRVVCGELTAGCGTCRRENHRGRRRSLSVGARMKQMSTDIIGGRSITSDRRRSLSVRARNKRMSADI